MRHRESRAVRFTKGLDDLAHRTLRWTQGERGRFSDRVTAPIPGFRHKWHLLLDGHAKPRKDETARLLERVESGPVGPAPETGFRITWVGHASFVVQAAGKTLLVDPVWSDRLPGGIKRLVPPGVPWEGLPMRPGKPGEAPVPAIDGVLVSHNHFDHLDAPTMRRLPRDTPIYCPLGLAPWFQKRGFTQVTELDWFETASCGPLRIDFVPAHHWSRRGMRDTNDTLWGGWVIGTDDASGPRRIYFSGDTGYGRYFKEIGARYPGIDVAIMGIASYAPRWYQKNSHTTPEEVVQACHDMGAKALVPMHWGTFRLSPEPVWEPVERLLHAWAESGRPWDDLWLLRHGESHGPGHARAKLYLVPEPARRKPVPATLSVAAARGPPALPA